MFSLSKRMLMTISMLIVGHCKIFALHETLMQRISSLIVAVPCGEQYAVLHEMSQTLAGEQRNGIEKIIHIYEERFPYLKDQKNELLCKEAYMLKYVLSNALAQERACSGADAQDGRALVKTLRLLLDESSQKVHPQDLILDLLLNVVIVSGEQFAESLFTEADKAEQKKLTDRVTQIGQSYKETQVKLQQQTSVLLKNLSQNFSQQVAAIQKSVGYTQALFGQEVTYIQRLINLSIPPERFVLLPIQTELFFKASPMTVPNSSFTWYNVFQNGDWEFDQSQSSFIQRGLNVGAQPALIKQGLAQPWSSGGGTNTDQADQNQIFTEYFTSQNAYQVQAEISLIQCTYPFFVGIVFNRARWLSGSPDRMSGYRLVGLYGTMSEGKPAVGLYLAQTQLNSLGGLFTATTPLHQMVSGSTPALYMLDSADVQAIGKNPLTYRCTVLTQESSVSVTLEKKVDTGWKSLFATSVNTLDPTESKFLFWYHGIGFMAPGCQAAFKIIEPKELASGGKV